MAPGLFSNTKQKGLRTAVLFRSYTLFTPKHLLA